jgi:hypothetical protein
MDPQSSSKNKKETFDLWMDGDHVMVHLDSSHEKVCVPSNLKNNPTLTLKMSHLFQGETKSNKDGITSYLKFSGNYFECIIPWDSIFALTNEEGQQKLWTDNIPSSLRDLTVTKKKDINTPLEKQSHSQTTERKKPLLQRIK